MTILFKNILLVDGTGQPPVKADVLVKNERIAALGYFPTYKADEVIDGLGAAYLAPGFIDISSNVDLYLNLFSNPGQKEYLARGVTSAIGGQSGISLAPLLYGSLDMNRFWTNTGKINVNWHTVKEFLKSIESKKFGINFGTLAGHITIRQAIIGDELRDLTPKEIDVFKYVLENAMKDGAFGLSLDLDFPLTTLAPQRELRSLLEIVEKYKGLFSVKLRNVSDSTVYLKDVKGKFLPAVQEIINLSKEIGVKAQINNFSCLRGLVADYKAALDLITDNAATADVSFNLHPFDSSVIPLFYFLPIWAQRGSFEDILKNIESPELAEKVKKDFPAFKPEELKIFNAPEHGYLAGKTLQEFCDNRNLSLKDGLLELMKLTKLRAELIYANLSLKSLSETMLNNRAMISSSFAGFSDNHPGNKFIGTSGAFMEFLKFAAKSGTLPLELAIKKITSLPAKQLGITDRGIIRDGYFADLVMFNDSKIESVLVNGKFAVKNGEFQDNVNGQILAHSV